MHVQHGYSTCGGGVQDHTSVSSWKADWKRGPGVGIWGKGGAWGEGEREQDRSGVALGVHAPPESLPMSRRRCSHCVIKFLEVF